MEEEPLLGSWKRSGLQLNPAFFQFREESMLQIVPTPSTIKERLIFGSPDFNPKSELPWLEYAPPADGSSDHGTIGNNEPAEPSHGAFDDSFMDNETMGFSHRAPQSISPDLTGFDLRGCKDFSGSLPSPRMSSKRLTSLLNKEQGEERGQRTVVISPKADAGSPEYCHVVKKHLHRSRTAPAMAVMADKRQSPASLERSLLSRSSMSVVSQAFIGLLVYLAVGVAIYIWREDEFSGTNTKGFVDALYFCIVTLCTIGYGDITPKTPLAKLFSCVFVLVGFGFVDILLGGMVSYVLDQQESLLLSAVTAGHHETTKNYLVDTKKGRMRIRSKVAFAFGVVIMCIGLGVFVMHYVESLGWLDSVYLSCMSVTTVGYGDHAFKTLPGRLFASIWLLVSTLAVARSFLYLTEARIDKRHRRIARVILEKEMTVGDLVAADLDNDGSVSKSDFVVYKLKQMGKIEEKDILQICRQFSRLDADDSGRITLSCLINLHEAQSSTK